MLVAVDGRDDRDGVMLVWRGEEEMGAMLGVGKVHSHSRVEGKKRRESEKSFLCEVRER